MEDTNKTVFIREFKMYGKVNQDAIIQFENGKFKSCTYHVQRSEYTLEDWKFLKKVAEKLIELEVSEWQLFEKVLSQDQKEA